MIVVTTPTSKIGSQLVPHLIAAGEKVRVIARNPAKLSTEIQGKVEVVHGSADNLIVLNKAFEGAEAVFLLLPPPFTADDIEEYGLSFARPAAEAIKQQGVKRVVSVSSLGRHFGHKAGLVSLLHTTDEMIEGTGADYRALWCPGFMENILMQVEPMKHQGMFFLPVKPDMKLPFVATRDIAAMAARLLLDTSWTDQGGVAVLGPEDLSPNDMADILSNVLGKPIRFQEISDATYKERLIGFGASEAVAQGFADMSAAIREGLYDFGPRTPENTTPTSFRQWCEEVLKPALR